MISVCACSSPALQGVIVFAIDTLPTITITTVALCSSVLSRRCADCCRLKGLIVKGKAPYCGDDMSSHRSFEVTAQGIQVLSRTRRKARDADHLFLLKLVPLGES